MNREKKITAYALIILAGSLVTLISLGTHRVAAKDTFSLFDPPLTDKEKALYEKIGNDKKEIESFIKTRLFTRKAASFVAELPKGVDYDPNTHGCPMPPLTSGNFKYTDKYLESINLKYATTFFEQLVLYKIVLSCPEQNGRTHPISVYCGAPVDKQSVLSQLTPPVSQEEVKLFDKANQCAASEIPKFLATRKYMRQIKKLIADLPAGEKLDPLKAPPIPEKFDGSAYGLDNDPGFSLLLDIFNAQIEKTLTDRAK